ncbi:MAG TPA: hypothetical protein VIM55_00175 [Mucilaginibacter sp.]
MENPKKVAEKQYHVIIEKQAGPASKAVWGIEYDTLTLLSGFLVPLISFVFGFIFSIVRDKFRDRRNENVASAFFLMWIKRTIRSAKALLLEIEKSKSQAESLDGFNISKPTFINLHINRLSSDQTVLYNAFVNGKRGKFEDNFGDYSKLLIDLDFLGDFQQMLLQNSQYIVDDFQNKFTQWNDAVRSLHRAKHVLLGRRAKNADKKTHEINEHFKKWFEETDQGLQKTYSFLDNLEPVLQKFYTEDPTDDDLADLLSIAQNIKVLYWQFEYEKKQVIDLFSNFHEQLNNTITEIETLSLKIDKKKNNRLFL